MAQQHLGERISRRTLAKGAAWTMPAVAIAVAAPAYAVSGTVEATTGQACKLPGNSCPAWNKGYLIGVTICNKTAWTLKIKPISVTNGMINNSATTFTVQSATVTVAPGKCVTFSVGLNNQDNSQNSSISGKLNFKYWAPSKGETEATAITQGVTFSSATTPPCDNCAPPIPA